MRDCQVCGGRRKITLPLRRPLALSPDDEADLMTASVMSKEFACPECSPTTSEDRVALLTHGVSVSVHPVEAKDPKYVAAMKREAAHMLVDDIVRRGAVKFTIIKNGDPDAYFSNIRMEGTIGVVSPNVVASMQERIKANSADVAHKVAEAAAAEVRVWGAHYTGDEGSISKGQAVDAIYRGMRLIVSPPHPSGKDS